MILEEGNPAAVKYYELKKKALEALQNGTELFYGPDRGQDANDTYVNVQLYLQEAQVWATLAQAAAANELAKESK